MRADFSILLDACVFANARVSDFYLRLSEEPRLLLPKWTETIWDETRRTYIDKLGWDEGLADRRIVMVTGFFPEAMVEGFEPIIEQCHNDPKDHHDLAAAIFAKINTIITFNVKHFTQEDLQPWDVNAIIPGAYLKILWEHEPAVVQDKIRRMADDAGEPFEAMLTRLGRSVPDFSDFVAFNLGLRLADV